MSENNMSLLSQSEIDTLINFLNEQKKSDELISGDTLSQKSINKLIDLMKSMPSIDKSITINTVALEKDAVSFIPINEDKTSYELTFKTHEDGQISIFASNIDTKDLIIISPDLLLANKEADCPRTWGVCIPPASFDFISKKLGIDYSDETLKKLKKLFAKVMYNDEEATVPAFYLP